MSMLRYYTDDSPGLKITPVRARTPSRNRQPSRGSIHFSFVFTPRLSLAPRRARVVLRSFRETFPAPDRAPSLTERKKQVVVLMMSVCFIAFVTMLHAVSKIYQYTSS
jgi:hypothetical protein